MKINMNKTKILVCNRQYINTNITINNITLERVNSFTYLGSKITNGRKSTMDIKSGIAQAKQVFFKKKKLFIKTTVSSNIRKVLIKIMIRSVVLYGVELWTTLKANRKIQKLSKLDIDKGH